MGNAEWGLGKGEFEMGNGEFKEVGAVADSTGYPVSFPEKNHPYCPTRGMGEKPSPLGEDFSLIVDVATRVQGKVRKVFFTYPLKPLNL